MTQPTFARSGNGANADAGLRAEAAIGRVPGHMIAAWNRGDGDGFAAPFSDSADFIAFEGTHLRGRNEIAAFHRELFDTVVKDTQLEGGVRFVRLLGPDLAVMHAWARYRNLPGVPTPGRESMQLFVLTLSDEQWVVEAMQNSRQITLQQQQILDDIATRPPEEQGEERHEPPNGVSRGAR